MAEINGLDREDLRAYAVLSRRRKIWHYVTDATVGCLHSGEHRGGAGTPLEREFIQSLGVARGSLAELETFLTLSTKLEMTTPEKGRCLLNDCAEIGKMLNALIKSLTTNH